MVKSKFRKLLLLLSGNFKHIKQSVNVEKKWYGNNYGGFYVCPKLLNKNSVIYSIGIGEDISFDLATIAEHNCKVYGFDPTPKSIKWIANYPALPENFIFFPYGLSIQSGMTDFYLPKNKDHISGSVIKQEFVNEKDKISVEMKSWKDIVESLGNEKIDVLKLDIEGAEYDVLDSILKSKVQIDQILIEFHERWFVNGKSHTIKALENLKDHGYFIFGISDSFEEISFIKTT